MLRKFTPMQRIRRARDAACVTRFHTARVIHDESVAEHSFNVVNLLLIMTEGQARNARNGLLMAALTHDMGEPVVGDIPSPVKRGLPPAVGQLMDKMEKEAVYEIHPYLSAEYYALSAEEERMLSLADKLDGLLKCIDELRLGNRGIREIGDRYVSYIHQLTEHWDSYRHFAEEIIYAYRSELNEQGR